MLPVETVDEQSSQTMNGDLSFGSNFKWEKGNSQVLYKSYRIPVNEIKNLWNEGRIDKLYDSGERWCFGHGLKVGSGNFPESHDLKSLHIYQG